jgi:hypothetical protein
MHKTIVRKFRFPLNLQQFAEDPNPDPSPDPNDPNKGKTFTQAELDQHVQQRVSRAEKAAQKALAKELGYDSVEAMQAALKKPDPKPEDKKSDPVDVDKLVDEKLKSKLQEQNEKTYKRLLAAEVKVLANELGFADWEDAHALADLSKVTEDDKGNLTGVKEALEELLKKKPHLGKQKPGTGAFGAPVGGGGTPADKKAHQEALINSAKTRGLPTTNSSVYDPWAAK